MNFGKCRNIVYIAGAFLYSVRIYRMSLLLMKMRMHLLDISSSHIKTDVTPKWNLIIIQLYIKQVWLLLLLLFQTSNAVRFETNLYMYI